MRNIAVVLIAIFFLSGCGLLAEGALVEGAEVGALGEASVAAGAGEGTVAGAGLEGEVAPVSVSGDLSGLAEEQGVLSKWLQEFAESGKTASMDGTGLVRANNSTLGRILPDGKFLAANGRYAGYLSAEDGTMYEYARSGGEQPVATLEGFIPENGVRFTPADGGGTSFEVLRPNVMVKVLGVRNGFYRVLLPDGAVGEIPATAAILTILALTQAGQCQENQPGAVVLKSGEEIAFDQCKELDDALLIHTASGNVVLDQTDLASVLTGDKIPNAPPVAGNSLDTIATTNASPDAAGQGADAVSDDNDTGEGNAATQQETSSTGTSGASGAMYTLSASSFLWEQPDARYRPIYTLPEGAKIELIEILQQGWLKVWILDPSGSNREVSGYIPARDVQLAQN